MWSLVGLLHKTNTELGRLGGQVMSGIGVEAATSLRGLRRFTRKSLGYLVEPQNQDRRLGGRRRDPGAPRSFDSGGHVAVSQGLRREDAICGNGVTVQ
jgi:hypothetical protein